MNLQNLGWSGFEHAAFNFGIEAEIEDIPIDRSIINKGALPSFVRKGFRYTQLKANVLAVGKPVSLHLISLKLV